MARFLQNRSKSEGKIPGSVIFIGDQKMEKTEIEIFQYNKDHFYESRPENISELSALINSNTVTWINIDGLHDTHLIEFLGEQFGISSLVLEDVVNTDQRPAFFEDADYLTIILKSFFFIPNDNKVYSEQISFILFNNCLITLQEKGGDFFNVVRERIRKNKGRVRTLGPDYLCYSLIDALIDSYFSQFEFLGTKIESLDEKILKNFNKDIIEEIYLLKTELNFIRKSVRPVKEILTKLILSDSKFIKKKTFLFIKDIEDLSTQINEVIESYSTMISDQLNIYTTNLSHRTNEVMKVLTIFSVFFIPLTFIVGVYGTNFDYLPELHFKYGYFFMWMIMITLSVYMFIVFKKRKWF
jgi:magnesium transporter